MFANAGKGRTNSFPKPGLSSAVLSHKGVPQEGCYDTEDIVVLAALGARTVKLEGVLSTGKEMFAQADRPLDTRSDVHILSMYIRPLLE